jgi:hypothetical protein
MEKEFVSFQKEFVSYKTACGLNFIGFSEKCLAFYDENYKLNFKIIEYHNNVTDILAPLYQQAFTWFREKHELNYEIKQASKRLYNAKIYTTDKLHVFIIDNNFHGYKPAESAILNKMIDIVEKNATKKKNVKQTGVEFLRDIYKNNYGDFYFFDEADKLQIQIMDEFSLWLSDKGWKMPYSNGDWYNENISDNAYTFSKVYKLFLKSRNE